MSSQQVERICVSCGKKAQEVYHYNGKAVWHKPKDGKPGSQCHTCYQSNKPRLAKDKPTLEDKMAETKQYVAQAKTPEEMRAACKSFTNYYEAFQRAQKK